MVHCLSNDPFKSTRFSQTKKNKSIFIEIHRKIVENRKEYSSLTSSMKKRFFHEFLEFSLKIYIISKGIIFTSLEDVSWYWVHLCHKCNARVLENK